MTQQERQQQEQQQQPKKEEPKRKSILKNEGEAPKEKKGRNLMWGVIVIYEFTSILGDNPATSEGSPLTLSWRHQGQDTLGIEYYESFREKRPRRTRRQLIMSGGYRDA